MALSPTELAALDLLIAHKQSGQAPQDFLNISVNNLGDVAAATAAVATVVAAVAAVPAGAALPQGKPIAGQADTLKELMAIRAKAVNQVP